VYEGNAVSVLRLPCVLVVVFVFAAFVFVSPVLAGSDQEAASSVLSAAEDAILGAYDAFTEAEQAGANVSGLLVRLNEAAGLLAEARMAFEDGNFDEATNFAGLSSEFTREAESEAGRLEVEASYVRFNRSWWFSVGSVLGVLFVLIASFFSYRYFKRRYYRRLLKTRPRVEQI